MLKVFRDNLKSLSWVLWAVILVFVLLVFVDFGSTVPGGPAGTTAAATVGEHQVSYSEFQNQYKQLQAQFRQVYGDSLTPELEKQLQLPIQALDRLVGQKILLQEARDLGVGVTDSELRESILEVPAFKDQDGRFIGGEAYENLLRANGYTLAGFEQGMRQDILLSKLNTIVASTLYVSDQEVEENYRDENERASIRFVQMAPNQINETVEPSQEDLEAYFTEHADEYELPNQRVVAYLQVDSNRLRQRVEVPESSIAEYYESHPDEFTQEEQVRARHILLRVDSRRSDEQAQAQMAGIQQRLASGEDFAELARELSDDPGSKDRGGDLGWFGQGRMIKEFEEAAFAASPGELVGPVKTSFGLHLIEVQDHREGGLQTLDKVQGRIRNRLLGELSQEQARELAEQLHARIEQEGIQEEAQLESMAEEDEAFVFRVTPAFGADDNVPGIGRSGNFSLTAFELEVGAVSDPVTLPRGYAILRVRESLDPRLPDLADVEGAVRRDVSDKMRQEMAVAKLTQARASLEAGTTTLDEIASGFGLDVQESGEFAHGEAVGSLGNNGEVAKAALSLDEGQYGGPVDDPRGAVLFEVSSRKHWDPTSFADAAESTRQNLVRTRVARLLASVIGQRRDELEVNYDRRLVEDLQLEANPPAG